MRDRPNARMPWSLRRRALAALALAPLLRAMPVRAQPFPERFDPKRDAAADVAAALGRARAEGKRVIVEVGGEWCTWCHILDRFFAANPDLAALRDARYLWVKVNFSRENENRALLARWPKIDGYPHIFVLDADGVLQRSQDTGALERGKSYDATKMRAFLDRTSGG
ncbi:MAG: thioredoxin family protein [Betaproteobacteria bacterium]